MKLVKDCELMILAETEPGGVCSKPVNVKRLYKEGTVMTFTGGSDISYYVRVGEKQDVQIEVPMNDYGLLCDSLEKIV
jgi:hypothetical protein